MSMIATARRFTIGSLAGIAISLLPSVAFAQSREDALKDFEFVLEVVRQDYAGFSDKTAGAKAVEFEALVRSKRAEIEQTPKKEGKIIGDVLAWFNDRHTSYSSASLPGQASPNADKLLASQGPFLPINRLVPAKTSAKQPLAGTAWASTDGIYQAVILSDPADPQRALGVITSSKSPAWSSGQVKFVLTPSAHGWSGTYYMRDHSAETAIAKFLGKNSVLRFASMSVDWVRVKPTPAVPLDNIVPSADFFLRRLSSKTAILRLPNFYGDNGEKIENLLDNNRVLLENTPNLVIDARNNSGGSDGSYSKLMEWIYTRPIYSIDVEFRATARNADLYEAMLKDPSFSPDTISQVRRIVTRIRNAKGDWVSGGDKPFSIMTFPRIMPNPKRVGIIATGAGSSGDQFVLDARQSRKVTTFGGPTAGVIDYSNVLEATSPSKLFILRWATSRSMRLPDEPIDNVGIQPDIPISEQVDDPITFVQSWLERQVD